MKIPQPVSNTSILSAGMPSQSSSDSGAFSNNGLMQVARGLSDVSRGIVLHKKTNDQILAEKKEKDDALWVEQSLSNYQRGLTDFEVDHNNQGRTDYLPAFNDKAQADVDSLAEGAPSPEAADALRRKAQSVVDSRYSRIASQHAANELNSDLNILESSWGNALSSYHKLAPTDTVGAAQDLRTNLANTSESIMSIYGQAAPDVARKMVAAKIEDAALAMAEDNPEFAKAIVIDNPFMDEQSRQVLLTKIDKKKEEVSLILKEDFSTAREKAVIEAAKNGTPVDIPLADYQKIYPGEEGIVLKRRDDSKISASVQSHSFLQSVRGFTPAEKQKKAEEFQATTDTEDKLQAFGSIVGPALSRDQRLFENDAVQWLYENNDTIVNIQKELDALNQPDPNAGVGVDDGLPGVLPQKEGAPHEPDQARVKGTQAQLYSTILKYQGYPTEGADPKKFMNKPPGQRRLLAKSQAEQYASQINSGTIDQVVATVNGILENYPTDELRAQVISDLTVLPQEKIKPEFSIVFQNATQSWTPDFVGAIQNAGELTDMNPVDKAKIKSTLATNRTWVDFKNAMSGPQNQRSKELNGYFDAIEIYARTKVAKGVDQKKAVDDAVAQILTSTMLPVDIERPGVLDSPAVGFTGKLVNRANQISYFRTPKQKLWIPRDLYGEKRSDKDIIDIGRRMGVALAHIHPDDVDQNQFSGFNFTDGEKRRNAIYNQIIDTGEYYPDPGGTTYHLTVKSAVDGSRIDLRNKDGKLFQISIDKLPEYVDKTSPWAQFRGGKLAIDFPKDEKLREGYPNTGAFWNYTQ